MEYRFLKQYTPNVGYLFPRNFVSFSSTPSKNIITPGVGQIFQSPPVFVPIYGLNSPHLIEKVTQNGGSVEVTKPDSKNIEDTQTNTSDFEISNPLLKRKLPSPVRESFQHPVIKTSTLLLTKKPKMKPSFKFKVVD